MATFRMRANATALAAVFACVPYSVLLAQDSKRAEHLEFGAGVAAPSGAWATNRSVGPLVRAGLMVEAARLWRLRLDGEAAWMPGSSDSLRPGSDQGDLRVLGGMVNLLIGTNTRAVSPYLLVGVGLQRIQVTDSRNPYGNTVGARFGGGVYATRKHFVLTLEVAPTVVLTDYGTGRDMEYGSYWPVSLGIRF